MADSHLKAVLLPALLAATSVGLYGQASIKVTTADGTSTRTLGNSVQARTPVAGKQFFGPASTNYVGIEQGSPMEPPNPSFAAGPDVLLAVTNRKIWAYANPNSPANALISDATTPPLLGQQFLTFWLGNQLNVLCPTLPRDNKSCVIDNISVLYDQMHGRFVVGFTAVDTGVPSGQILPPGFRHISGFGRKASWVLIISKYAQLGIDPTQPSSPFTNPNQGFTQGNIGGVDNKNNWLAFYGDINDLSNYTYSVPTGKTNTDGTAEMKTVTIRTGNIGNEQYTNKQQNPVTGQTPTTGFENTGFLGQIQTINNPTFLQIDCNTANPVQPPTTACFMPTSMRIGIDNNNLVIASAVINDNIDVAARSSTNPAYAGARVRVYRKKTLYTWQKETALSRWSLSNKDSNFVDLFNGDGLYQNLTVNEPVDPANATSPLLPVFYEPDHLRGRAIASFNANFATSCFIWANQPTSSSANPCDDSTTYLVGAKSTTYDGTDPANAQNKLYVRPVVIAPFGAIANAGAPGGVQWYPWLLAQQTIIVPLFWNPGQTNGQNIPQVGPTPGGGTAPTCVTPGGSCDLYVGDDRPQTVVYREGFLYIARTAQLPNRYLSTGTTEFSTVAYDIARKFASCTLVSTQAGQYTVTCPIGNPMEVLSAEWQNGNFWGPMYESPANVTVNGTVSPIWMFPWLEKLFVSTTYVPSTLPSGTNYWGNGPVTQPTPTSNVMGYAGLYDMKVGEDLFDTAIAYLNPITGTLETRNLFGWRGSSSTDPNNGSLWNFGAFAKNRASSNLGFGQWGTFAANYNLTFGGTDPYGTSTQLYTDVTPDNSMYGFIQIAKNVGIGPSGTTFGPDNLVNRAEMAKWVILSQMDEAGLTAYLKATGGCYTSFADVAPNCDFTNPGGGDGSIGANGKATNPPADGQSCSTKTADGKSSKSADATCGSWRYIEAMYRRGYTKGKGACTSDPRAGYCPTDLLTRAEMSTFIIRAKMNTVFPTVLSGCPAQSAPACADTGDNFGIFFPTASGSGGNVYFDDVPSTSVYAPYINKMREMRITNGKNSLTTFKPDDNLRRDEIAVFMVRSFFQ